MIPLDSFITRDTAERYKQLLESARSAHMNMIRVHGGGIYPPDEFYTLCDRLGLMVWQDFMFSSAFLPDSNEFFDNIRVEIEEQIKRIRSHASLALWCGNNESEQYYFAWRANYLDKASPADRDRVIRTFFRLFYGILPEAVARYASPQPYLASSFSNEWRGPFESDQFGDQHYWDVYNGKKPVSEYEKQLPRFMSEFGFQSFPSLETLGYFARADDQQINSTVMYAHNKYVGMNETISKYVTDSFGEVSNFSDFVYLSQVEQAEALKTATEHLRRNRPHVMGALFWQLNDCWPAISWATIDYFGRWKAAQFYAERFDRDLLLSIHTHAGNILVNIVSDRQSATQGVVRVMLIDTSGRILSQKEIPFTANPMSTADALSIDEKEFLEGRKENEVFIAAEFYDTHAKELANNLFSFVAPKYINLQKPHIQMKWTVDEGHPVLILTTNTVTRSLYLQGVDGSPSRPSDNFFDLLPGRPKRIRFPTTTSVADLTHRLTLLSLADAMQGTSLKFAPAVATARKPNGLIQAER